VIWKPSAREQQRGLRSRGLAVAVHDDEIQRAEVIAFLSEIAATRARVLSLAVVY
jgi:hypothetical protein